MRLTLRRGFHTGDLLVHLCEAVFDEFRGITDRNVWQQVEVDSHAGELVEVIDCLWANDLLGRCYRAQRHEIGGGTGSGCDRSTACSCSAEGAAGVTAYVKVVRSAGVARSLSFTSKMTWYWSSGCLIR